MKQLVIIAAIFYFLAQNVEGQRRLVNNDFKNYHFSIDNLNLDFEKQVDTIQTVLGDLLCTSFYVFPDIVKDSSQNLKYNISHFEYPFATLHSDSLSLVEAFFKTTIDGALKSTNGKLNYEEDVFVQGFPSKLFRITFNEGKNIVKTKMVVVDNIMYLLQVSTYKKNASNVKMERFIDSFRLL